MIGVRPEHVRLWQDGLIGPIEGRVAYVEALGRETLVGVDTDAGARLVAAVEGRARLQPGEPLRVGLVADGLRQFDADRRRARASCVRRNSCTIRASPSAALESRWGVPAAIRASSSIVSCARGAVDLERDRAVDHAQQRLVVLADAQRRSRRRRRSSRSSASRRGSPSRRWSSRSSDS